MIIQFLRKLFGLNKKVEPIKVNLRQDNDYQDTIDYDGMGNYGRFPMTEDRRYK